MAIAHLKLYHFPMTRSARVLWALHETTPGGFEIQPIELHRGEQYAPAYLALNPNHNVPLLEINWDDGRVQTMIESGAIVGFLADAFPEVAIAPPPGASVERADYLQMLQFGATQLDMMLWQVRIHEHILADDQSDARTIARYRAKFETEGEPQLRRRLERGGFICGEAFTAADCIIGHDVGWARLYGLCQDPVFAAYLARLAERPAYAAAFADVAHFSAALPAKRTVFSG
jgi:glutathione S-transferase